MALRGIKPIEIKKRLKMFVYGAAGVGKTMAAIQFPKPYIIDTEKGVENSGYVELIQKSDGAVFQSCDFDEMIAEIKALLTTKHDYKTLVIDSLTMLYNDLLDKCSVVNGKDNTGFGRHYGDANKKMKHLINLLLRLDMNIIITSHSKNEYGSKLEVTGQTFDCYRKMDYLFDLVLEISKFGNERNASVRKTRLKEFPDNDRFLFSYTEISKRYGNEILEKIANAETLASAEQVKELQKLIELLNVSQETIDKWLSKSESENFSEMPAHIIQKCIESLRNKISDN